MTPTVETPLKDPVSISCERCCFMDYGRYETLEATAIRHAREAQHPVGLYLNLVHVGTWQPGAVFVGASERCLCGAAKPGDLTAGHHHGLHRCATVVTR